MGARDWSEDAAIEAVVRTDDEESCLIIPERRGGGGAGLEFPRGRAWT